MRSLDAILSILEARIVIDCEGAGRSLGNKKSLAIHSYQELELERLAVLPMRPPFQYRGHSCQQGYGRIPFHPNTGPCGLELVRSRE